LAEPSVAPVYRVSSRIGDGLKPLTMVWMVIDASKTSAGD
jgi:hypothetical protein